MSFAFAFGDGGTAAGGVRVRNVTVPAGATGRQVSFQRQLGSSSSTFSLLSGSGARFQLDNGDGLALTSGLAAGATDTALVQETVGSGATFKQVAYALNCTGAVAKPSVPAVTLTAGNGQISVGWVDGSNGGSVITAHKIYYDGVVIASPTGASPYVITGLPNGVPSKAIQVSAVNVAGEGDLSSSQTATPQAGSLTPYVLIDRLETLTNKTASSSGSLATLALSTPITPPGLGAASVNMLVNGASNPSLTLSTLNNTEPGTSWAGSLIAVQLDFGDVYGASGLAQLRPSITVGGSAYATQVDSVNVMAAPIHNRLWLCGKVWAAFNPDTFRVGSWTGAKLTDSTATTTKQMAIQVQNNGSGRSGSVKLNNLIRITSPQPAIICLTVDDNNVYAITEMAPRLKAICDAKGVTITPTAMSGRDLIGGGAGKLSIAQAWDLKNVFGWAHSVDSGPNDEALTWGLNPQDAYTNLLKVNRDWLVQQGLSSVEDAKHIALSYGAIRYADNAVTKSVSAVTNSATITVPAANVWGSYIAAGCVVKGTGLATPPTVLRVPSDTTIILSAPITLASTTTLTFCANQSGVTVTCNNTTTVTGINTTGIVVGQKVYGRDVVPGTTVVDIPVEGTSGTITTSDPMPDTCTIATFILESGAFAPGKMIEELNTRGFLTSRGVTQPGYAWCSQFGPIDYRLALDGTGYSVDSKSGGSGNDPSKIIADAQLAALNGTDLSYYMHAAAGQNWTDFETWVAAVADIVAAGKIIMPSLAGRQSLWQQRLAFA